MLATGYAATEPGFLSGMPARIRRDERGRLLVDTNYRIDAESGAGEDVSPECRALGNEIYVQNAELYTHGFVAPDLGMGAYRNSAIIRGMLGREHYAVETRIAFQQFGVPTPETVRIHR